MESKTEEAKAWLAQTEGKTPVVASPRTQARHDSEWRPTVVRKDDIEGLRRILKESQDIKARYSTKKKN